MKVPANVFTLIELIVAAVMMAPAMGCRSPAPGERDGPLRVVLAIAEPEYETMRTLPEFAERVLHGPLGYEIEVVGEDPVDAKSLSGLPEALERADVLIVSIRRRALATDEMAALKKYLAAGKPLIGIRTASHAFAPRGDVPEGFERWETFDAEVFGGNYHGHHGAGAVATITAAPHSADHPILRGVATPFDSHGSLYQASPLRDGIEPLLVGQIPGRPAEPVAWATTSGKSRVFYTSLGHKDDFASPAFVRLLRNAVLWALDRPTED